MKLDAAGHEILPVVAAGTLPSGPVEGGFYPGHQVDELAAAARDNPGYRRRATVPARSGEHRAERRRAGSRGGVNRRASAPKSEPIRAHRRRLRSAFGYDAAATGQRRFDAYPTTRSRIAMPMSAGWKRRERMFQIKVGAIHPVSVRERAPMLLPAINMASDQGPMVALHANCVRNSNRRPASSTSPFTWASMAPIRPRRVSAWFAQPMAIAELAAKLGQARGGRRLGQAPCIHHRVDRRSTTPCAQALWMRTSRSA